MTEPHEIIFWQRITRGRGGIFLCLPLVLFTTVFLFYPLSRVLILSLFDPNFTLKHFVALFQSPVYVKVLLLTLEISFITTVLCLLLGYPVAYVVCTVKGRWATWLMGIVVLCFWTSILVRTYSWMILLQRTGVINTVLLELGIISKPLGLMYNLFGVCVGMVHVLLPYMVMPLYGVMEGIDLRLLKAGQNLGATPFKAFWKIYVPLSLPGIGAGCILVFVIALGFFITPALLGGGKVIMISNLIDSQVTQLLNWGFASALSLALILVTFLIFILSNRYLGLAKMWGG
jgi:putative spermidine/putrescine transport system permease protein